MTALSYTIPVAGVTLNSIADPEVSTALQSILTWANGASIDISQLTPAAQGSLSVGAAARGYLNITTSQSTSSATYTTLSTADQITGIVLPTGGLLRVWYRAIWSESVLNTAKAAIFLGSNQLQAFSPSSSTPVVQEAHGVANVPNVNGVLMTLVGQGLQGYGQGPGYTGPDATTGMVFGGPNLFGGPTDIFAAAGTYSISVQFLTSNGTVTVSNRTLRVQALSFA